MSNVNSFPFLTLDAYYDALERGDQSWRPAYYERSDSQSRGVGEVALAGWLDLPTTILRDTGRTDLQVGETYWAAA